MMSGMMATTGAALSVAVAQPVCVGGDVERNAREHAGLIRRAGARLVVFPELSLTGYHLDAPPVEPDDMALAPLVEACVETDVVALAGAPVVSGDDTTIAMLRIDASGGRVVYRKGWLSPAEQHRFTPGDGPTVIDVDGWRVGLGICKDTGTRAHVDGVAALDLDLYAAGVLHHRHELDEQDARATSIARRCGCHVAFASFAGRTGGGYEVPAGNSGIWDGRGRRIARTSHRHDEVTSALLRR